MSLGSEGPSRKQYGFLGCLLLSTKCTEILESRESQNA